MSDVHVAVTVPFSGGSLTLRIDVTDVAAVSENDRKLILAVIDQLIAWTGTLPGPVVRGLRETPEVLRGVGRRP